ncbi:hypothetical protein BHE74_00013293 [Ensete ventricosum]|nr:hypothetical protein GW17_00047693 [Ensete ventricosum]RWW78484.1 hypothetical protein BHE74_00013293 [Ensete ventricosum]
MAVKPSSRSDARIPVGEGVWFLRDGGGPSPRFGGNGGERHWRREARFPGEVIPTLVAESLVSGTECNGAAQLSPLKEVALVRFNSGVIKLQ